MLSNIPVFRTPFSISVTHKRYKLQEQVNRTLT